MKLWAIVPELLVAGACLVLVPVAGLAKGRWRAVPAAGMALALVAAIAASFRMLAWAPVEVFGGTYAVDGFACVFKILILVSALVALGLLVAHFDGRPELPHAPVALGFTTLGAVGLSGSLDLGLIVLFIQMLSFGSYILVALVRTDRHALEAVLKYFLFGAAALAVMAYGLTWLYGLTGSLDLRVIGPALQGADGVWIGLALALVLAGYGFEITLVPFHLWSPDVIEGTTAPVAGLVAVLPKIGAVAGLMRFLLVGLPGEMVSWPTLVAVTAAVTMTFGNLVALKQVRAKRLLAYSSIAQAGYVLVAVAAAGRTSDGLDAAAYQLAAYLFMNFGAFAVVAHVERSAGDDSFDAFRGLVRSAPAAAAAMILCLLSLAGFPPLAGFAGKVLVLEAAIAADMGWLAILAAINMAVGLYYYLALIVPMVSRRAPMTPPGRRTGWQRLTELIAVAGTLALGITPGPILALVQAAAERLQ